MAAEPTHYELIGVSQTATTSEIATAYRKKSLKLHPDKNPNNPEAADLFHKLFQAHELLKDKQKRDAYDIELNAKQQRAERFAGLNNKRKAAMQDLEEQEAAYKRMKEDQVDAELKKQQDINRLKEQSRLMKVAKEKEQMEAMLNAKAQAAPLKEPKNVNGDSNSTPFDPLEATLKLKWPATMTATIPFLSSKSSLESHLVQFAHQIDTMAYFAVPGKKAHTAMIAFKTISAAVQCFQLAEKGKLLRDVSVKWAKGQPPNGIASPAENRSREASTLRESPAPSPKQPQQHNEEDILAKMRARQAERDRMAEEIRRQEAEEE